MNKAHFKDKIIKLSLLLGSLLISLIVGECLSRLIFPIRLKPVFIFADGEITHTEKWRVSGKSYRQVTDEYDVITTITSKGYRVPEPEGQPEIIFCGDSFTFGQGLADEETFVYQFFQATGVPCVNLGDPGAGTMREIDLLLKFISEEKWRPRQVWLFMLVMTDGFFFAGNDLADNLAEGLQKQNKENCVTLQTVSGKAVSHEFEKMDYLRKLRNSLVESSNLIRIIHFTAAPQIKAWMSRGPGDTPELYQKALELTQKQLLRLKQLSEQYDFAYKIFVFHPLQDITRNSYERTLSAINQISPSPVIETASLFKNKPETCYYRYDQHFNKEGSRRVAQFLVNYYHGKVNNNSDIK